MSFSSALARLAVRCRVICECSIMQGMIAHSSPHGHILLPKGDRCYPPLAELDKALYPTIALAIARMPRVKNSYKLNQNIILTRNLKPLSRKYTFHNKEGHYFVSFSTVYWIDVFIRRQYFETVTANLNYCIANILLVYHAKPYSFISLKLRMVTRK